MGKLKIDRSPYGMGEDTIKVSGFEDGELNELKSMEHKEAEEKLLEMLNSRNGNYGTQLSCGYGVYGVWFDNEAAYIHCGSNCD